MMYRSGYATKDENQKRILAIDISREGFEWALEHSCLSKKTLSMTHQQWIEYKKSKPVRIQWDPERDIFMNPLPHRTIQIGLSGLAIEYYISHWIKNIIDITPLVTTIHQLIKNNNIEEAKKLLPIEAPYFYATTSN